MSKQGQYNYKGINAQAWAAMSLFLQYLRDPGFSYIRLEAPKFEDFNLVFNDGHKIICESKYWKHEFNFADLKKILGSILKKTVINEKDEILIVCMELNNELKSQVENMKYWSQLIEPEFKKKKFSEQQIAVLDKVKFWKAQEKDNHLIVYSLFGELLDFWLPEDELEYKADSILIKSIYEGSAKGEIYRREDILNKIESIRKKASKYSGYFDDERINIEIQLQNLIRAIENNRSPVWAPNQLSALSSKPSLMFFVLDRIKDKEIDDLKNWDDLWELYKVYRFAFSLSRIFENNLHTDENKRYVIDFFKDHISETRRFYQHDFFDVDVVKITKKILTEDKENRYLEKVFEIVKKLITERRDDIFYLKVYQDDSLEREEIAKLLKDVYERADPKLKEKMYRLIIKTFNLIEDEGEFSHYSPWEIFEILRDWVEDDFEKRLLILTEVLAIQYDRFYKKFGKKLEFRGWEHIGGTTAYWGHDYKVSDRHFIGYILEPAIKKYYDGNENKDNAWSFVLKNCISKTEDVNKKRPDFLNRSALPVILDRYEKGNDKESNEGYEILKEFILSRRGIPSKSELIYQEILKGLIKFSDDKKWRLIEVSLNKYGVPINVFIEEIVSEFAKKGNEEAKKALRDWLKKPQYYKKFRLEMNIIQNIRTIFDSDFDYSVSLFEDFINSDYFINEQDYFESYEVAILLYDILKKECKRGLEIVKDISKQKGLTKNQQILLCFSLFNYRNNDQSDDIRLLEYVYEKFIDQFLSYLNNDINKICEKLNFNQAREALVQFSERLAQNKKISEALRIVEIFVNDPDPYLPSRNPDDPENKYNEHQRILNGEEPFSITSVRGWCAWVLMKCSALTSQDYIEKTIDLTERLTKDENWYVKHMASFALSQLAQNQLTVLPNNREALERARTVERIAFNLLHDIAGSSDNIKKALAKSIITVFDHIRILNEKDTLEFVNTFAKFPDDAIAEAAPLFIFFAEFRKDVFRHWKWKTAEYYNNKDQFDDKKFKKILLEIINKIEPEKKSSFAFQFENLIKGLDYQKENADKLFNIAYKYLDYLSNEYIHEVFDVIYRTIKNGMGGKHHFNMWHNLYLKCLRKEKMFYDKNFEQDKSAKMYWWPSYYNEDILMFINKETDKNKFLDAFDIITSFPKELEIHDSNKIISLLDEFPKTNKKAKEIVDRLFQKNPSRYYELNNQWR